MKPTFLIAALLLFSLHHGIAQTDVKEKHNLKTLSGCIAAGVGIGMPLGKFGSTQIENPRSGAAQPGIKVFIDFAKPVAGKTIGFAFSLAHHINAVGRQQVVQNLAAYRQDGNTYGFGSENYHLTTLLTGIYFTKGMGRFAFDIKGLAGMAMLKYPHQDLVVYDTAMRLIFTAASEPKTLFAPVYGGNFTVRYTIVKHLCAFAESGVIHTNVKYTDILYGMTSPGSYNHEGRKPITILHIAGGIGYQFP